MLGGVAAWLRWRDRRKAEGKPYDKPNLVMSTAYQVVWEKFCQLWQIEMRTVPITRKSPTLDIDQAIVAVGVSPNPIVPTSIEGLELGRKNTIVVGENMQTNLPTIFAGGDIVRGGATVILAMGDGRRAAASMHAKIQAGEI